MRNNVAPSARGTVEASERVGFVLRLYVTGATPRSSQAISNARRIFDKHLGSDYELEIVDIYQEPLKAEEHQIVASPTLVKLSPGPTRRVIGDLSDEAKLLKAFGIAISLADGEAT
jgi:circadian clock protein KaiB